MKIKILLITLLFSFNLQVAATEQLGNKLAVCSAKFLLLAAVLKNEREYSEEFMKRTFEWRAASIKSFMTEEGMKQEDAVNAYKKVAGDTTLSSGIREVINDKPKLIKRTEEMIRYIDKSCLPLDNRAFTLPNCYKDKPKSCLESFHRDVNFDGEGELIKRQLKAGQRFRDSFEVYKNDTLLTDIPFNQIDSSTKFDPVNKTIEIMRSGGACGSEYETYKVEDGKAKSIRLEKYDSMDKDGNRIGCTKYIYEGGVLVSEEKVVR